MQCKCVISCYNQKSKKYNFDLKYVPFILAEQFMCKVKVAVSSCFEMNLTAFPCIFRSKAKRSLLHTCRAKLQSYLCVQSMRAGEQTDFRIAILPVDVRGGSGCLGNQLALKCGAAPLPRPLYKYPYGFDVNTRQPENMMPLCKSTRVLSS